MLGECALRGGKDLLFFCFWVWTVGSLPCVCGLVE